jgi:flagellar FliL protein
MASPSAEDSAKNPENPRRKGGGRRLLLILLLLPLLLGGAAAGAWFLVPGAADAVRQLAGLKAAPEESVAAVELPPGKPSFVEFPEMTLSLPNGGRPRQLRLKLAVEVNGDPATVQAELLSPRIYDSLLLYLRTLHDSEMEGALAMDRLRGDLHRRLDLVLGPGRVRDVLITSFVVA